METEAPTPSTIWPTIHLWLGIITRCLLSTIVLSVGFAGLKLVETGRRLPNMRIQIQEEGIEQAIQVGLRSLMVFSGLSLIIELLLRLAVGLRTPWSRSQMMLSFVAVLTGAGLAFHFYSQEIRCPKETMLVAGGALLMQLTVAVQLTLFEMTQLRSPQNRVTELPLAWYASLALLMATFAGGMRGWTDTRPQWQALIEYRDHRQAQHRPSTLHDPPAELLP